MSVNYFGQVLAETQLLPISFTAAFILLIMIY